MIWHCASIRRDGASLDVNVGDVVKLRYEGQSEPRTDTAAWTSLWGSVLAKSPNLSQTLNNYAS